LSGNRFASMPWLDAEVREQPHQRSVIEPPETAELPVGHPLDDVALDEDVSHGAPFDRFDSLDDFIAWARLHASLHTIVSVGKVPYNGTVYNLSVEEDASYIVPGATVHNCRCYVKSLTERQVRTRGLKVQERGVDVSPDEGWDYHVGKEGLSHPWDRKGRLPDCLDDLFAEGGCVKIVPGQKTWKDFGQPDLREVSDELRRREPPLQPSGKTREEAVAILASALGLSESKAVTTIETPVESVLIHYSWLPHMVGKPEDARERYASFIVPTLEDPYEVYVTDYEDGPRMRYIGLFTGKENLMAVVRVNKDGSLLWNVMQARDKSMNKQRVGHLLWSK